jgi:hypothetical protein
MITHRAASRRLNAGGRLMLVKCDACGAARAEPAANRIGRRSCEGRALTLPAPSTRRRYPVMRRDTHPGLPGIEANAATRPQRWSKKRSI